MAKPCKFCGSTSHTGFSCRNRPQKPLKRSAFKVKAKPLKRIGKYTQLWIETRILWIKLNGSEGHLCEYCGKPLKPEELTLDHKLSRSRRPDLRYELSNLVPACYACNKAKGSLSREEFKSTPPPSHGPLPKN